MVGGGASDARAAVTDYEPPTLLGVETGIESSVGLVNGTAGPWGGRRPRRPGDARHPRHRRGRPAVASRHRYHRSEDGDTTLFDKSSRLLDKARPLLLPARPYMAAAIGKARQG